jgi:hypothetical protein
MDTWSPVQLHMMRIGGNRRFREFLNSYDMPASFDIMQKYYTKAADYYRQLLKAEAEGRRLHFPPPGQAEGIESFMEMPRPSYLPKESNYELYDPRNAETYKKDSSGFWGNTKNFLGVVFEKTSEVATNTASNFMEQGFLVTLKDATITTLVKSKEIIEDIKVTYIQESDSYNSVKEKSKQVISAATNVFSRNREKKNYQSLEDFTFGGDDIPPHNRYSYNPTYTSSLKEDQVASHRSSLFLESLRSDSVPISSSYNPSSTSPNRIPHQSISSNPDFLKLKTSTSTPSGTLDLLTGD